MDNITDEEYTRPLARGMGEIETRRLAQAVRDKESDMERERAILQERFANREPPGPRIHRGLPTIVG